MGTQFYELIHTDKMKLFVSPIVFFAFFNLQCIIASCPDEDGWFKAGDSCYLLSSWHMNWYMALEFCMGHGGHLAHIESAEEEASLESVIPEDVTYWIDFQYSDYVDDEYTNWASGQPDADDQPHNQTGCVFNILGRCTTNKGWWDTYCYSDDLNFDGCSTHTYALCETPMK